MYDWTWVNEDDMLRANVGDQVNGSETRRARLYVSGLLYDNVDFKLQFDFAGEPGEPSYCRIDIEDLAEFVSAWLECHLVPVCIP